jgi:hypothetical protein
VAESRDEAVARRLADAQQHLVAVSGPNALNLSVLPLVRQPASVPGLRAYSAALDADDAAQRAIIDVTDKIAADYRLGGDHVCPPVTAPTSGSAAGRKPTVP